MGVVPSFAALSDGPVDQSRNFLSSSFATVSA